MVSQMVRITSPTGLALEAAGALCDLAVKYESHIMLKIGDSVEANAKSILSVLGASIQSGQDVEIVCDGKDEAEALAALTKLLDHRIGE